MLFDRQHAWWLTLSRLTSLLPSLIARRRVGPQKMTARPKNFKLSCLRHGAQSLIWPTGAGEQRCSTVRLLLLQLSVLVLILFHLGIRIRIVYWWHARTTNIYQEPDILNPVNTEFLIYMFAVLMHWWVRSHSSGLNNLYAYEMRQNLRRGLCTRKTG